MEKRRFGLKVAQMGGSYAEIRDAWLEADRAYRARVGRRRAAHDHVQAYAAARHLPDSAHVHSTREHGRAPIAPQPAARCSGVANVNRCSGVAHVKLP